MTLTILATDLMNHRRGRAIHLVDFDEDGAIGEYEPLVEFIANSPVDDTFYFITPTLQYKNRDVVEGVKAGMMHVVSNPVVISEDGPIYFNTSKSPEWKEQLLQRYGPPVFKHDLSITQKAHRKISVRETASRVIEKLPPVMEKSRWLILAEIIGWLLSLGFVGLWLYNPVGNAEPLAAFVSMSVTAALQYLRGIGPFKDVPKQKETA